MQPLYVRIYIICLLNPCALNVKSRCHMLPVCTVLLSELLICFCTFAAKIHSGTFIVLDKNSDLDKLSSMHNTSCLFPCFMMHCMFSFFRCLCFSSQKRFASAGGLKVKEGQRQQHNKPSTQKRRGGGKERKI